MLSKEDIRKLASLARIKVSEEEEGKLAADMDNILGYVNQIQEVSSGQNSGQAGVQDTPVAGLVRNVMRDDSNPHESGVHTDRIIAEAPQKEGKYVKVKKIL